MSSLRLAGRQLLFARAGSIRACYARSQSSSLVSARRNLSYSWIRRKDEGDDKDNKARPDLSNQSILNDDILAKAGAEPSKKEQENKKEDKNQEDYEETEEDREKEERWRGTAKKRDYISSADRRRERYAKFASIGVIASIIGYALYQTREWDEEEAKANPSIGNGYTPGLMWKRFKTRFGNLFTYYREPAFDDLLPPPLPEAYQRPYTLVIGLEDVLVHSEWTREHGWRTAKRPGLDYFLGYLSQYYEIVLFSNQYMMNVENIVLKLDPFRSFITYSLFREATRYKDGHLIKDLSLMNRDMGKIMIVDCDKYAYSLQPENAVAMSPWKGNPDDKELIKLIPFLEWLATSGTPDVRPVIKSYDDKYIPDEYLKREAILREKFDQDWKSQQGNASTNLLSMFLGIKTNTNKVPKMPLDYIREQGQKNYLQFIEYIRENGEKFMQEEKEREQQMLSEQKMTLNKLWTEGMPTPEQLISDAEKREKQEKDEVSAK